MTKYTLDAKGKKLGRVASEAAVILMGKKFPNFAKNTVADVKVEIINTSKINIDAKKLNEKNYVRYSGYPGGLFHSSMKNVVEKKGFKEIFKRAVHGMLPGNKLRARIMKNLLITE